MHQSRARSGVRNVGFTLIEIMVVLVIMGAIASAVGVAVLGKLRQSRISDTKVRARTIQTASKNYLAGSTTECPTVADLLESRELDPTTDTNDAWGNGFIIECDDDIIHVHSAGPDGQHGNDDDVGF